MGSTPPAEQLALAATRDVPKRYRGWAGRWVLVGNGQVHLDAAGLLGCYYRDQWLSSSAALLGADGDAGPPVNSAIQPGWHPVPGSRFASIRKLFPSQHWHVGGKITHRALLDEAEPRDYATVLAELEDHLTGAIRAAARLGPLGIPLTGGFDSRLILAAAHKAGVSARTFTQEHDRMSLADRTLPPKLSGVVGLQHTFVRIAAAERRHYRRFDEHTAGHSMGMDRQFLACGQWEHVVPSEIILRGGCFELGRCFFYRRFQGALEVSTIAREYSITNPECLSSLAEWVEWSARHPEEMDWRDRLYWEQRIPGWLSSVEQALDLLWVDRCHVANSHRYYELVLQVPVDLRRRSRHHVDLIARMAPGLLAFPFNPPDPLRLRIAHEVRRAVRRPWRASKRWLKRVARIT